MATDSVLGGASLAIAFSNMTETIVINNKKIDTVVANKTVRSSLAFANARFEFVSHGNSIIS